VVLGGTSDDRDENMTPDDETTAAILDRCAAVEPRVRDAEVLAVRVGLRPCRPTIRLEAEQRERGVIIHNYGHGGSGVTLSWGCAAEVADLAQAYSPRL
jgi:D-amino-acid oxidase